MDFVKYFFTTVLAVVVANIITPRYIADALWFGVIFRVAKWLGF